MASPINLDIVLKYHKSISELNVALKNSGKIDVSLRYQNEINEFKRAIKSASRVPVTLDYAEAIRAFKQQLDSVCGNVSISFKWDNALAGLKEALKNVEAAPIEIKFAYQQQLERLRSEVAGAFADIEINSEFLNVDPAKVVEKIQKALDDPAHGLQMFNDQSRFDRAKLVKYIERLTREMDKLTANPDYSIHIPVDFGDVAAQIKEKLTGLEAGVTVPAVPTDLIEQFSNLTKKAVSEVESALAGISFDQLTAGLDSFVGVISDKIAQLPEDAQAAVDLIIEQFNRIKNFSFDIAPIREEVLAAMRSLVEIVNNETFSSDDSNLLGFFRELGGAISDFNSNPPSVDSINALTGALEGLAQGFSGVVARADELMNGSFARLMEALNNLQVPDLSVLQQAIQDIAQSITVSFEGFDTVGLIDAISVLVHSLQSLPDNFIIPFGDEMNTFIERLSEVVSNIGVQRNDESGVASNDSVVEAINTNTSAVLQLQRHLDEYAGQLVEQLRQLVEQSGNRSGGSGGGRSGGNVGGDEGSGDGGRSERRRRNFDDYDVDEEGSGLGAFLTHIRRFIRDLQQSGLQFPRWAVKLLGWVTGINDAYRGTSRHLQEFARRFQAIDDQFNNMIHNLTGTTLNELGLAFDQVLVDAQGNITETLGEAFNRLGTECKNHYERLVQQALAEGQDRDTAERNAREQTQQHYQEQIQEMLHSGNIRNVDGSEVDPAVLQEAQQRAANFGDNIIHQLEQVFSQRVLSRLQRRLWATINWLLGQTATRAAGAAGAAAAGAGAAGAAAAGAAFPPLLLVLAALLGMYALFKIGQSVVKKFREIHGDNVKRAQVGWETAIKHIMDARVRSIKQSTDVEIAQIQAVSEVEKKRIENVREMNKNKFSMYSWELDMQRQLYDLEVERLQAQKQREVLQQKVQNISTNADAALENNKEWNEGKLDWTSRTGVFATLLGKRQVVDKYGGTVNSDVIAQATKMSWFNFGTNGGWQTGFSTDDYVKIFQSMSQMLEKAGHEWFVSQIQPIVKENESYLSELTALEAGGLMTDDELGYIDELIGALQNNTQALIEAEKDIRFSDAFTKYKTADELIKNDRAVYNARTHTLGFFDGREFITLGTGDTKEEAMKDADENHLPLLRAEAQAKQQYVEELKEKAKMSPEQQARLDALKEEDTKRKAARDYSEALIKQQNELKKTLVDEITKFTSNSGAWNASNASKYAAQETIARRMQHATELNDPRLIGNKDAEIQLRARHDWEDTYMSAKNELTVQQDWDKWLMHNITRDRAKFDLEQSQINARHKLQMENIQAVAKVQIDNLNLQRDLIKRMLDHSVAQFKILNDPYGKNKYDTMKELNSIRIDRAYDARITRIKQENNTQNQEWEKKQKDAIQAKVERQEDLDFEEKWNLEENLLEEKQKLEMELLEKEFQMRLKQIEIEVKYKHDLEEHYQKMREANTEAWLKGHTLLTDEELQAAGEDLSKYVKEVDDGKGGTKKEVVMSKEERQRLSDKILSDQSEEGINRRNKVAELRQNRNAQGYEQLERMLKDRGVNVEAELDQWYKSTEAQLKKNVESAQTEEDKKKAEEELKHFQHVRAEEKKAKTDGEFRSVEDIAEAARYKHNAMLVIAKGHMRTDEGLVAVDDERRKDLEEQRASLVAKKDSLLSGVDITSPIDALKAGGEISDIVMGNLSAYSENAHNWMWFADQDKFTDDSVKTEFMDKLKSTGLSDGQKDKLWNNYVSKIDEVTGYYKSGKALLGFKMTNEDITELANNVVKSVNEEINENISEEGLNSAAKIEQEIKDIDAELGTGSGKEGEKGRLGVEDEEFAKLVAELEGYDDSETQAILQQSELADKIAKCHDDYLANILAELKNSGIEDVKKALEKSENNRQRALEQQKQMAERRLEKLRTEEQSQLDIAKAQREDLQKGQIDSLEAAREIKKSVEETRIENMKRQDQFNADIVKREADYRQTQRGANTDLAISLMQSKSGMDRLKALSKYNSDSQYNAQLTAMDERHRAEMESLMRRGNFTEEEKARLEARQQDEKSSLEESKKYADAIRDAMGDVGGIRSLVTEGTGNTSGLTETWERIQQAAFGHVEDAAADAVINMDRAQALQHAALMSLLTMQLPAISQAINNLNARNTINQYNQLNNMVGNPPTIGGWS